MSQLGVPISRAFFPRHARMFCQLLTTTLSHGPRKYHSTALALLESVLQVVTHTSPATAVGFPPTKSLVARQVPDLQLGNASEWLSSPGSFAPVAEVVGQASPQKSQLAQQVVRETPPAPLRPPSATICHRPNLSASFLPAAPPRRPWQFSIS